MTLIKHGPTHIEGDDEWASLNGLLGSGKYPNLSPLVSLSGRYQQSPSGLLVPNASPSLHDISFSNFYLNSVLASTVSVFSLPVRTSAASAPIKDLPTEQRDMPVVGFRAWYAKWDQGRLGDEARVRLFSTGVTSTWEPGVNAARCLGGRDPLGDDPHDTPSVDCDCGLYVVADLDQLESHLGGSVNAHSVVGAVMGWGRVIQHGAEGWRAQYARPIALLDLKRAKNDKWTERASKEYGVPIMGRDALLLTAKEYGDELPDAPERERRTA